MRAYYSNLFNSANVYDLKKKHIDWQQMNANVYNFRNLFYLKNNTMQSRIHSE